MTRPRRQQSSASDVLYGRVRLAVEDNLPVLGVPVRFQSNDPEAARAFREWFGIWRDLRRQRRWVGGPGVTVRIIVHEGKEHDRPPVRMAYRMPDPGRVFVHTGGSFGVADIRRRVAVAYVTEQLLRDRAHFQYGVLEMLTMVLVTSQDRCPIHASAVSRGGATLLFAGPSGSGKSTLALSARKIGCRVLGDDAVYVQLEPARRIWAMPGHVHLAVHARRHFPELARMAGRRMANGKTKVQVRAVTGKVDVRPTEGPAAVCLLGRASGRATLRRVRSGDLQAALAADLRDQAPMYGAALRRMLRALCRGGGWRLRLSSDPGEALPFIDAMLEELRGER